MAGPHLSRNVTMGKWEYMKILTLNIIVHVFVCCGVVVRGQSVNDFADNEDGIVDTIANHELFAVAGGSMARPEFNGHNIEDIIKIAYKLGPEAESAIVSLSSMNSEKAADALSSIAKSKDRFASGKAIWALSRMDEKLAVPRMIALLDSPEVSDERKAILITDMQAYSMPEVESAIIKQVAYEPLMPYALTALGTIGTERSLELLRQYSQLSESSSKSIASHARKKVEARMSPQDADNAFTALMPRVDSVSGEYPLDWKSDSYSSTNGFAVEETRGVSSAELSDVIASIGIIEKRMRSIREQTLSSPRIKEAADEYRNVFSKELAALEARVRVGNGSLPQEGSQKVLREMTMQNPMVLDARRKVQRLMIDEARAIEPNIEKMEGEYIELVNKMVALKWPSNNAPVSIHYEKYLQ